MNYEELGLIAGVEIHQQLDTQSKLFCRSPTVMRDPEESTYQFDRYLRPTPSEMGEVDQAALVEAAQERRFHYLAYDTTCLVEADEEPPRPLNQEALDISLVIARLLNMSVVDQVHTMRKVVIDGSNTSGFQRTAFVASDGYIDTSHGQVGVDVLQVEEEAAQRVEETESSVTFSLDRLGIPLVEIGTAPDIKTPEHARETAATIGMILRSTGRVKRGIGTIRQDVNVSIREGARVEIKGVQELDLIEEIVAKEVERQVHLLEIKEELENRGAEVGDITDVTSIFGDTGSNVIRGALDRGGCVRAVRLKGFAGLVGREIQPDRRLGTEFSDYAKRYGVGGIFHTDELPAYGITEAEVESLRDAVDADEGDAVVLCADREDRVDNALEAVQERAEAAIVGVPEETRRALPNGNSAYMRPLPGAARMYPETDIPPVSITRERLQEIELPELMDEREERYIEELGLGEEQASLMARSPRFPLFEEIVGLGVDPSLAVRTLEATPSEIRRDGAPIENLEERHYTETLLLVAEGEIAKEGVPSVLAYLAEHPDTTAEDAASELGLGAMGEDQVRQIIASVVEDRLDFVREREMGALGPLMGVVMQEVRGKVDGEEASQILREEIQRVLE